ncbi:hypothetical protein SVAN01_03438 [Stagonosporopsis vannaccii]|nr:hypothetical protein SVAN01_03438 [Stagonosporopsis vannaccii]
MRYPDTAPPTDMTSSRGGPCGLLDASSLALWRRLDYSPMPPLMPPLLFPLAVSLGTLLAPMAHSRSTAPDDAAGRAGSMVMWRLRTATRGNQARRDIQARLHKPTALRQTSATPHTHTAVCMLLAACTPRSIRHVPNLGRPVRASVLASIEHAAGAETRYHLHRRHQQQQQQQQQQHKAKHGVYYLPDPQGQVAPCIYGTERTKRRKLDHNIAPFAGTYRFVTHVAAGNRKKEKPPDKDASPQIDAAAAPASRLPASSTPTNAAALDGSDVDDEMPPFPWPAPEGTCSGPVDGHHSSLAQEPHPIQPADPLPLIDRILAGDGSESFQDRYPTVWLRVEDGGEYAGPSSGISILSDLNLEWLQSNVRGSEALCGILKGVRSGILNHLTRPKCIAADLWPNLDTPIVPKPLPLPQEIERFVDSYFSDVQVIYPILDRSRFEAQLHKYNDDPSECTDSWKALLYAVVASGCRAALSDETAEAFQESGREAWAYFRSALCYETKLVHGATNLTAIQALTVMAVFAQGMSSPQRLEYTLCSTASRLAQGLALNLRPPSEWNMSDSEKCERNRTFWILYCLDKTIALRTGRPPTIRDEEITCSFPRDVTVVQTTNPSSTRTGQSPTEDSLEFDFFLVLTKFSRICSKISHHLYSAVALCRPSAELVEMANDILASLESWRQSIPARFRPGQSFNRLPPLNYASRQQVLALHFSYSYAICSVHRRFMRFFTDHEIGQCNSIDAMLTCKPVTHIEAARSMVLLTKHLDIESYSSGWLVFYYPMTAISTLFMHIVCYPLAMSVSNDIALMDAVVGFFGRLEYITSGEAAFTRMGELVQQARYIVSSAHEEAVRTREPNQLVKNPQLEPLTTTVSGSSITNEHVINGPGNKSQDTAIDGINIDFTAHNGRGTGQDSLENSTAVRASRELGSAPAVHANVELAALASSEVSGCTDFMESAEHLRRSLRDLTQPMTGLFADEALNVDWLDAWMMPRHSGSIGFDRELASLT